MKQAEEHISSGMLELYVAGVLTADENRQIRQLSEEYPEIRQEIEAIESSILSLTKSLSPSEMGKVEFEALRRRILLAADTPVYKLPPIKYRIWAYTGWAAAIVFALGAMWIYNDRISLEDQLLETQVQNQILEQQVEGARNSLAETEYLLSRLRDKNIEVVPLAGQEVAPDAFVKVYWNKNSEQVLIDAQGLPEPPPGMVYQVWSLKLNPLTPVSIGLLDKFTEDPNKIFALNNPNASEAFGITLEPAGGSESPTMEQLYTLGLVKTS